MGKEELQKILDSFVGHTIRVKYVGLYINAALKFKCNEYFFTTQKIITDDWENFINVNTITIFDEDEQEFEFDYSYSAELIRSGTMLDKSVMLEIQYKNGVRVNISMEV